MKRVGSEVICKPYADCFNPLSAGEWFMVQKMAVFSPVPAFKGLTANQSQSNLILCVNTP